MELISKQVDNDNTQVRNCLEILQFKDERIILEVRNGIISPAIGYELVKQKKVFVKKTNDNSYEVVDTSKEKPDFPFDHTHSSGYTKNTKTVEEPKLLSDVWIDCTVCDGHGKVFLADIIKKIKFTPDWYLARNEFHYFIAKDTPICFKRTHVISTIGKKSKDASELKGFGCVVCKKILEEIS